MLGTGTPVVVLDSGLNAGAAAWSLVQPAVATFTRVCSYDRVGTGNSDPALRPYSSSELADGLRFSCKVVVHRMFDEVSKLDIARVERLFSLPHLNLVMRSVTRGNSPARVMVDTSVAPRAALMWDGRHCIYLTGTAQRATSTDLLQRFFKSIATEAKAAKINLFKVYLSDSSWETVVQGALPAMRRRDRVLLRRDFADAPKQQRPPDGYQIDRIDQTFVEDVSLNNLDLVLEEIRGGWPSLERFLRYGFGVATRHAGAIVCWCTAEYVSDGMCGIGIETIPEFRGRGLATSAAGAFVLECEARGVRPHWDSWADNRPSLRVAEKVGFQPLCVYQVYVGDDIDQAV